MSILLQIQIQKVKTQFMFSLLFHIGSLHKTLYFYRIEKI